MTLAQILGPTTRSIILHGSLTAGGFRPGRSDIDLLAVVDNPLTDTQIKDLTSLVRDSEPDFWAKLDLGPYARPGQASAARLDLAPDARPDSDSAAGLDLSSVAGFALDSAAGLDLSSVAGFALDSAAGLDLHVVTTEVARFPTPDPPVELYLGRHTHDWEISPRVPHDPDVVAELSMARADGRALTGAAPTDILAPVPPEWVISRGRHWLRTWQSLTDDVEHLTFMRETAYRIWHFAIDGRHSSKPAAMAWAHARDPSLAHADLARVLATVLHETA
ncbi:nucleotidyltransferase domain-containing protein [Actinoplanes sp. LDG1-06]|uniref:Nucleotidyltransferase domain-containing protein n=1 Tax=Paractinoplanes ovalisporus TaxID=2810368 RepID=A0ABS2A9V8_9ACTN|nr:nucleotidyltransferase domain-containing protein [Actinoplanes ovalisporus]MBM2616039.1 nucleotidyltransferase domain-containing protein [Actinoplanes ovalisporus]